VDIREEGLIKQETGFIKDSIMPRLSKEFKQAIQEIPVEELQKLVIMAVSKNQEIYDWVNIKYVNGNEAETELFTETKEKSLGEIYLFNERGILQKNLASAIGKAVKHINYYEKVTGNNSGEAELLLYLLNEVFENYSVKLGTCWTVFDSKLAITTNRLYNIVTKKLHEDYLVEYTESLNRFLEILHSKSNHLDYVYNMPKKIE
jgi:transcriptional regulator with XRE-family HTH domain